MHQKYDERNKELILYVDGELVHRDKAGVSLFDSTVQNGDGVWEGLRLYDGRIFRLPQHLGRLRKSAEMLKYEGFPSNEQITIAIKDTLKANDMHDGVHMRLTVSRGIKYTSGLDPRINTKGCRIFIVPEFKPPVYGTSEVTLVTTSQRRPFADVLDQTIHSCNQITSILAKIEANDAGADDALMLDTDGNLAETNATHVFLVRDGAVRTSTTIACPTGITRAAILELCEQNGIPHETTDVPESEIHEADEVFVTGTMGELVPVSKIDQTEFSHGPMTRRLTKLFKELTQNPDQGTLVV